MATIKDAIEEVVVALKTVNGIDRVLDGPVDTLPNGTIVLAYPNNGNIVGVPVGVMTSLSEIWIDVLIPMGTLDRDTAKLIPLCASIPNAFYKALSNGTFTDLQTFTAIRYEFIVTSWADKAYRGLRFVLENAKVQGVVT